MNEQINREKGVHGERWNAVHEGYFSAPSVAAPLIRKIQELADKTKPDRIVDLGGGTGFLLSQLRAAGIAPDVTLVNLDDSPTQLAVAKANGISCRRAKVDSFLRRDVGPEKARYLFMMRSVLHYFGKDGLRPVLRHLRTQARPGELFVHQTASFRRRQDADCLNNLYLMMGTRKWYPTVAFLWRCLREEGWRVLKAYPAPPLRLKDDDLRQRYHLGRADIRRIRDRLSLDHRVPEDVFRKTGDGFCAFLHYRIYVCTPAVRGYAPVRTPQRSVGPEEM